MAGLLQAPSCFCRHFITPSTSHWRYKASTLVGLSTHAVNMAAPLATQDTDDRIALYQYEQLVQGTLHKRYKRFLADMVFKDDTTAATSTTAHSSEADKQMAAAAAAAAGVSSSPAPPAKRRRRAASPKASKSAAAAAATAATAASAASAATAIDEVTVVHCPNTGSMAGLLDQLPAPAACSVSSSTTRKYKHTLEMVCLQGQPEPQRQQQQQQQQQQQLKPTWVGVHSALANKLAAALLSRRLLPLLGEYEAVQSEVTLGSSSSSSGKGGSTASRFDFMLTRPDKRKVFIEVKSITMAMPCAQWASSQHTPAAAAPSTGSRKRAAGKKQATAAAVVDAGASPASAPPAAAAAAAAVPVPADGLIAVFPDAVSLRAQRHVQELTQLKAAGHDAVCLFVIQRNDCCCFAPAAHIDPAYSAAVQAAKAAGVQMMAVVCEPDPGNNAIWFKGSVPVL